MCTAQDDHYYYYIVVVTRLQLCTYLASNDEVLMEEEDYKSLVLQGEIPAPNDTVLTPLLTPLQIIIKESFSQRKRNDLFFLPSSTQFLWNRYSTVAW